MWSVRMRASKNGAHISGAEGLFDDKGLNDAVRGYVYRAMVHPRGKPDEVVLTVERLKGKVRPVRCIWALPVATLKSASVRQSLGHVIKLLKTLRVSDFAVKSAQKVLSGRVMSGAAVIDIETGERLEPDKDRGIRVSRLGVDKGIRASLSRRLGRLGLNTDTVKEALTLASKVSSSNRVLCELCVSDDPGYTTGYIASKGLGYLRIPHIKKKGSRSGGRVFFVSGGADIAPLVEYLEKKPVVVASLSDFKGTVSLDEALDSLNR